MAVYILHFSRPLKHANHYTGFAKNVDERLEHHRNGTGARLTQVCNEQGIEYKLARVFEGKGRWFERKLKNTKSVKDYCPICMNGECKSYTPRGGSTNK